MRKVTGDDSPLSPLVGFDQFEPKQKLTAVFNDDRPRRTHSTPQGFGYWSSPYDEEGIMTTGRARWLRC